MERSGDASAASATDMQTALTSAHANVALAPLRIDVPTKGVRYSFRTIDANRSSEEFSIPYSSHSGAWLARILSLMGTAMFWAGLWLLQRANHRRTALSCVSLGVVLVIGTSALGVSGAWPLVSLLILLCALLVHWADDQQAAPGGGAVNVGAPSATASSMASRGHVSMFIATVMSAVTLSACGSRVHHAPVEHANQPPPPAAERPPDPTTEPQPDPAPGTPEQDFILSDEPRVDSAELLEATKHDCCEQASPAEVKAGIRDQPAEPATRRH